MYFFRLIYTDLIVRPYYGINQTESYTLCLTAGQLFNTGHKLLIKSHILASVCGMTLIIQIIIINEFIEEFSKLPNK